MKKPFITLLLMVALTVCAIAQDATLSFGATSKALGAKKTSLYYLNYMGEGQPGVYMMEYRISKPKGFCLTHYDNDLQELATRTLEDRDDMTYLGGYVNEQGVDVVTLERTWTSMRTILQRYDLKTLDPVGEAKVLKSFTFSKNDNANFTLSESPDGELMAGIYLIQTLNRTPEAQVELYDHTMEPYWSMSCPITSLDDVVVTDSGEVLLGGYTYNELDKKTHFEILYMDGEVQHNYTFEQELGYPRSMEIVRCADGKLIVTGVVQDPDDLKERAVVAKSIYVLLYNMESKTVEHYTHYELTHDDNVAMTGKMLVLRTKSGATKFLRSYSSASDEEGVLVGYRPNFIVTENGVPTSELFGGILLLRIDTKGSIKWVHTLRQLTQTQPFHGKFAQSYMRTWGQQTMIVYCENAKNQDLKEDANSKVFFPMKNAANMVVNLIERDGVITTMRLALPDKTTLMGRPHKVSDTEYTIIAGGTTTSQLGKLKIEK